MRFCIKCGTREDLVGNLCSKCFSEENPLARVPEEITLSACISCGSVRRGHRWIAERDLETLAKTLIESKIEKLADEIESIDISLPEDFPYATSRRFDVEILVRGRYKGEKKHREERYRTTLVLDLGLCPSCSRSVSGYYEAILQLRGHPRRPLTEDDLSKIEELMNDILRSLLERGRSGSRISKKEKVRGGFDYKFVDANIARRIANEIARVFGASIRETAKIYGRGEDGRPLYRITISVRLPAYRRGDIVLLGGRPYMIREILEKKLVAIDLSTWNRVVLTSDKLEENNVIPVDRESIKEGIIISLHGNTAQIMDLKTYDILEVSLGSRQKLKVGDHVKFLKLDGKIYLLPEGAGVA